MDEPDILYENGDCRVGRTVSGSVVYRSGSTYATSDSAYARIPDGLSIAVAATIS